MHGELYAPGCARARGAGACTSEGMRTYTGVSRRRSNSARARARRARRMLAPAPSSSLPPATRLPRRTRPRQQPCACSARRRPQRWWRALHPRRQRAESCKGFARRWLPQLAAALLCPAGAALAAGHAHADVPRCVAVLVAWPLPRMRVAAAGRPCAAPGHQLRPLHLSLAPLEARRASPTHLPAPRGARTHARVVLPPVHHVRCACTCARLAEPANRQYPKAWRAGLRYVQSCRAEYLARCVAGQQQGLPGTAGLSTS